MSPFLRDLRDRKIVQWALAYLAGAWLVIEVTGVLSEFWGWSSRVGQVLTVVAGVGLVAVVVVAWYHGERGRQRVAGAELLILGTLFVIGASLLALLEPDSVTTSSAADGAAVGSPSLAAPAREDGRPSIAVLPFTDMSATGDQGYFGDGVAEEILNALAKVPGLRVAARTSTFRLRDADIPTVAERLGVGTVLEGSVRREDDMVRVTAQLIDATSGFHLWSEQYDREVESVIAIQEQIALRVVEALKVELGRGGGLVSARTESPEAYDRYLLGRSVWNARGDGIRGSIEHFREALRLDPDFALAYSGLADAYVLLFEYNTMSPDEAIPLARAAAERALELDPTLAEPHTSLAEVLAAERSWEGAEARFRRALELNPGYLTAHHWYGWLLTHLARHDEAIQYLRGAKALDPLSAIVRQDLAAAYYHARRFREALDESEACVEARLCTAMARDHGRTLLAMGRFEEALTAARERETASVQGMALAALGRGEEARRVLEATLEEAERTGDIDRPIPHLYLGEMYVAIGEQDAALEAVERAEELGLATGPVLIREWPAFDPIREHPRFQAVLERMGYPGD